MSGATDRETKIAGTTVAGESGEASSPVPVLPSDRFFLLFEGTGPPVSCLWCFTLRGEPIRSEDLRQAVGKALEQHPRARARLRIEGRGRRLYWERGKFGLEEVCRYHPSNEAPGDDEALIALVSRIQNRPFQLERGPLVEVHAYPAREKAHGFLLFRFHHALADAVGSLVLLRDLFQGPGASDIRNESPPAVAAATPAVRKPILRLALFLWRAGLRTRFAIPDHVYSTGKAPGGEFACAIRSLATDRVQSLADAARRLGVGANDLIVASCARAIAMLKEEGGGSCGTLRIMINRRFRRKATSFAIHSSAFPVWIRPRDRPEPLVLARRIHEQVREAVRYRIGDAIRLLERLLELPPPFPRLLVSSANRRVGSDSFVVSNVGRLPEMGFGPAGARVVRAFGVVRPPNGVGALLTVVTVAESTTLALSYLADALTKHQANRLLELIENELGGFERLDAGGASC